MTSKTALGDWIQEHNAIRQWAMDIPETGRITAYRVNGRVFLVLTWHAVLGWEIFTCLDSNDVKKSISDAAKRLGVQS